jgi:hypothetical protein
LKKLEVELSDEVAEWIGITAGLESDWQSQPPHIDSAEQLAAALLQEAFEAARDADQISYLPQTPQKEPGDDDALF